MLPPLPPPLIRVNTWHAFLPGRVDAEAEKKVAHLVDIDDARIADARIGQLLRKCLLDPRREVLRE
jgi:hypothetical protein